MPQPTALDSCDGVIAYMDYEIRELLDSLERRGVLDRTVEVISSDHGDLARADSAKTILDRLRHEVSTALGRVSR